MTLKTKLRLLSITALGGLVSSLGFAIKAGPELDSLYEMYVTEVDYSEEDAGSIRKRYLCMAFEALRPSLICGSVSAASILLMKGQALKSQAVLSNALYLAMSGEHKPLTRKEEKRLETSKSEIYVYDPYTAQYFPTNVKTIERAINKCNVRYTDFYRLSLNRMLKEMGGKPKSIGDEWGWEMGCDRLQDFYEGREPYITVDLNETFIECGKEMTKLKFVPEPSQFELS